MDSVTISKGKGVRMEKMSQPFFMEIGRTQIVQKGYGFC